LEVGGKRERLRQPEVGGWRQEGKGKAEVEGVKG
jgi:hypothetical protein